MGIRHKIGIPLAIITVILGYICYDVLHDRLDTLNQQNLQLTMVSKVNEVEASIEANAQAALGMAAMVSALPAVADAYTLAAGGDMNDEASPQSQEAREALRAALAPVLAGYETGLQTSLRLHYHLPNGRSLVRLWRDKQVRRNGEWVDVSDDISDFRATVVQINRQGQPLRGIELGRGGFAIRGLAPVKDAAGNQLGSVEVLGDFGAVFERVATSENEGALLFMNAEFLPITTQLQDPAKNPMVENAFVQVKTKGELVDKAPIDAAFLESATEGLQLRVHAHLAEAAFPIRDYSGKQIGVLVYVLDVSAQDAFIDETGNLLVYALLILLGSILAFFYFMADRAVIKPVKLMTKHMQGFASGDQANLKARLDVKQQDEIGHLATWFNRIMAKIEETMCDLEASHNLINAVPDPVFAVDDDFNFLMANTATQKYLGCDLEKLKGTTCASHFKTQMCGTEDCPIHQAKKAQGFWQADTFNIGSEENPVWISPSGDVLKDCFGKKVGYVEVARIVTPMVEKEQQVNRQMQQIGEVNAQLIAASEEIVSATDDMLNRFSQMTSNADRQADRVQETATAMEEMNATVLEVAANASKAAEQAGDAREQAEGGADIVAKSVQAISDVQAKAISLKENMGVLGQRAENIGQIMNVISDIADQTNLLALNAAIEAARAGEAGRGFAVVADEVRKLAEKTMQATKEVGDAIRAIQDGARTNVEVVDQASSAVESATELANQSGQALQIIVARVIDTTDQVQAIAAAAEEQSAASEEINQAISEVNAITAETVDGLRTSDDMLQRLASLAGALRQLASKE